MHDGTSSLNQTVDENLQALEVQYADLADYLSIVQKLQGQLEELVRQVAEIPFWDNDGISLEELAAKIELYDWYRWGSGAAASQRAMNITRNNIYENAWQCPSCLQPHSSAALKHGRSLRLLGIFKDSERKEGKEEKKNLLGESEEESRRTRRAEWL